MVLQFMKLWLFLICLLHLPNISALVLFRDWVLYFFLPWRSHTCRWARDFMVESLCLYLLIHTLGPGAAKANQEVTVYMCQEFAVFSFLFIFLMNFYALQTPFCTPGLSRRVCDIFGVLQRLNLNNFICCDSQCSIVSAFLKFKCIWQ